MIRGEHTCVTPKTVKNYLGEINSGRLSDTNWSGNTCQEKTPSKIWITTVDDVSPTLSVGGGFGHWERASTMIEDFTQKWASKIYMDSRLRFRWPQPTMNRSGRRFVFHFGTLLTTLCNFFDVLINFWPPNLHARWLHSYDAGMAIT